MPDVQQPSVRALLDLHRDPEPLVHAVIELGPHAIATSTADDWERVAIVVRSGERYPAAIAWRAGYALYHLGHTERAEHFFENADRERARRRGACPLLCGLGSSAWGSGDADRSEALGIEAFEAAERCGDDSALTWAWESRAMLASIHGEPRENLHAHQRALDHALAARDDLMESRIRNNLGSVLFDQARYAESLEQFEHALRLANSVGHLSSIALIRHNVADVMLNLGRIDEALVEVEAARAIWAGLESPMVGAAWQLLADIQRARGNTAQAAMAYREAVAVAEESDDTQTLVPALTGSALIQVATDPKGAEETARRLLSLPSAVGLCPATSRSAGSCCTAATRGGRRVRQGGPRRGVPAARPGLAGRGARAVRPVEERQPAGPAPRGSDDLAGDRQPDPAAGQPHRRGAPVRQPVHRAAGPLRLRSLGVQEDAYGIAGPLHAISPRTEMHPVHLHVLGTFVLSLQGRPVTVSEWPSRKARDILKVLAGRGARGIRREALADLLWPDDPDPGSKLSVALSKLRRVLDPARRTSRTTSSTPTGSASAST